MGKQKRSSNTYQKIDTIFMRDANNCIMPYDGLVSSELEWLRGCKFECSEKVDGTNIRIEVTPTFMFADVLNEETGEYETDKNWPLWVTWSVDYKGKTDNAQIPNKLLSFLKDTYTEDIVLFALGLKKKMYLSDWMLDKVDNMHFLNTAHTDAINKKWVVLDDNGQPTNKLNFSRIPKMYTIYGEGFGAGIQKVGGNYFKTENKMIGFDVKVDDTYLLNDSRDEILNKMNMPIVPTIGYFTIDEAIEYVKTGFKSLVAENASENFLAEGLVCKSPVGICDRSGKRIVFKVKTCDWQKYFNKYGTYDKVDQPVNTNYKKN